MLWEKQLSKWATELRAELDLPVRVDLWAGKPIDLGNFSTPLVTIKLKSPTAVAYLLDPSLDNLGEAYIKGKIDVEGRLSDIIAMGYALADSSVRKNGTLAKVAQFFQHTKASDRKAIQYHYDVSNEFYHLWLDENMVYSCAYFEIGNEDLDTAQLKKIDLILSKIELKPGQRLLDIGCGWGALVMRAATKFGASCVGITLSQNQYELAKARVQTAGLSDRIEIRLQDYRDVQGTFDRITSVGMFEHVGRENLPLYFARVRELLADDGIAMNHGITSADPDEGPVASSGGDFIDRYVFPDGELPHIGFALQAAQRGGLEALDVENLRRHYARTLEIWSANFEARTPEIRKLVDEEKYRIWRVYLAACAYGFERGDLSIHQIVCRKAGSSANALPWSRRYICGQSLGREPLLGEKQVAA